MSRKRKTKPLRLGDLRAEIKRQLNQSIQNANATCSAKDESIHQIRVRCKRIRAFLRLISKHDKRTAKRLSQHVRDAARSLSAIRDSQVIPHAIAQARAQLAQHQTDVGVQKIEQLWQSLPGQVGSAADLDNQSLPAALRTAVGHLQIAKSLLRRMKKLDDKPLDATALVPSYRRCRRAIRDCRSNPCARSFHELRKATKTHLYQCRFLKSINKKKLRSRCRALRELADSLGAAQDVAVAQQALEQSSHTEADRATVHAVCQRLSDEIDAHALTVAVMLFFDDDEWLIDDLNAC